MRNRIEIVFAVFGFLAGTTDLVALFFFFGPQGKALPWAGITSVFHFAAFPFISAICGWSFSRCFFRETIHLRPFTKGCLTVACGFLVCVAFHFLIVLICTDLTIAAAVALGALVFGGILLGLPAILVGGMIGHYWQER